MKSTICFKVQLIIVLFICMLFIESKAQTPCSGTPLLGTTLSSLSSVCPTNVFNLSTSNSVSGSGVSYIWQKADNSAFTINVSNISTGATTSTSQTNTSYYRCISTCASSSLSDTSTPVMVTSLPFYTCYCGSHATSVADGDIFNVSIGSLNNSSSCTSLGPGAGSLINSYANYQSLAPPNVPINVNTPISIGVGTCNTNFMNVCSVFIDYNQNGVFDNTELVYSSSAPSLGTHTETGTVFIPSIATLGITGMRVINSEQNTTITNPCMNYIYGETEDYLVNITSSITTSIQQYNSNENNFQVSCLPNPFDNHLNIEIQSPITSKVHISIIDITGRVVMNLETNVKKGSNSTNLDLKSFVNGLYLVKITDNKSLHYSQMIQKN